MMINDISQNIVKFQLVTSSIMRHNNVVNFNESFIDPSIIKLTNSNKKIPGKRKRLSAEARRKQLIDTAITLTAQKSLGQASHTDIAKLADIAVSTVFFYFPTVADLHDAIIDELEELLNLVSVEHLIDDYDSAFPFSIFNKQLELIATDNEINKLNEKFIIIIQWSNFKNVYSLWPGFKEFVEKYQAVIKKIIQKARKDKNYNEDIDSETAAKMFTAIHRLVFTLHIDGENKPVIQEIIKSAHNHLFVQAAKQHR